jgi:PQQ-like domain
MRISVRRLGQVLVAAAMLTLSTGPSALAADWPTNHRSNARDGNDTSAVPFNAIGQQWISSVLDGHIYGSPLLVGNQVIVATENNSIYSLDATSGAATWAAPAHFGAPMVPATDSRFGCHNVSPLGILSTPVVDTATGIIYAVAFVQPGTYELVAVHLSDGSQAFTPIPIAPTGFDPFRQQQRAALALANGNIYVGFGGYWGDCGSYHGFVFAIKADGTSTTLTTFNDQAQAVCKDTTPNGAAIWGPDGPSVDAGGNVYVTSGNGFSSGTGPYDCGETVFKLSPTLTYLDSWAPSAWAALNGSDNDIGSVNPALVGATGNTIFQTGKNGWGYLLNTSALSTQAGHIGGEAFAAPVCNAAVSSAPNQNGAVDQVFSGTAYADPYVYVPCPEGIKALQLGTGPSFTTAWSSPSFSPTAPIVSGGVIWAIDHSTGTLHGLDPANGTFKFSASLGSQTNFSTPAAGQGRIYVADGNAGQVRAFGQGAGQYHPLTPSRIYDSRNGSGALGQGTVRNIQVLGLGGVPATGVAAVVINVTVANTTGSSYLTVYPAGFSRPTASNLNWTPGRTVANLVEVAIGANGQVGVYNAVGNTDVIFDVAGWVNQPTGTPSFDGLYKPLVPARILDTRNGIGGFSAPVGPGQTITVHVAGQGLVPSTGAEAVILNLTATDPTAASYLTVYPTGATRPTASNVNFVAGQTLPNRAAVALGTGGQVDIYNPAGSVNVIADVNGWFTDTTPGGTGSSMTPMSPVRILDTRNGTGGFTVPVGPNQSIALQVAGVGGVPSMAASIPPKAVVLNVTVTAPTTGSYLTVWPDAIARPVSSDLNFVQGATVPNLVVVQIGATGTVDFYNAAGSVNVIADVMGWFG